MFPFVIAGRYRAMVTFTGAEVVVAPRSSEATAVSVCGPSARRVETLYGLVESLPSDTIPSKNWTFVTLPSVSLAEARMVTLALLLKMALSTGFVMDTLGGVFPTSTVTFTTADVVERPRLSVATAVSAWGPEARLAVTV